MADESGDYDEAMALVREEIGLNQVLGLYDVPSFARRGQATEQAIAALWDQAKAQRERWLVPVREALRAYAAAAGGPDDWQPARLAGPVEPLATACGQMMTYAPRASRWRRRAAAKLLTTRVRTFNRQWPLVVAGLGIDAVNRMIDGYNRFYVLEKECVLGSPRLAARRFVPLARLAPEDLLSAWPPLPDPGSRANP